MTTTGKWMPAELPPDVQGAGELAFLKQKGRASHLAVPAIYRAMYAVAPASPGPGSQDSDDAARWRALMSSVRMHFMGCAGFDLQNKPGTDERQLENLTPVVKPKTYQHFGMEFWSEFGTSTRPWSSDGDDKFCRQLLIAYTDHLRAAPPGSEAPVTDERAAFAAWAKVEWATSDPPDAAWIGWQGRAQRGPPRYRRGAEGAGGVAERV